MYIICIYISVSWFDHLPVYLFVCFQFVGLDFLIWINTSVVFFGGGLAQSAEVLNWPVRVFLPAEQLWEIFLALTDWLRFQFLKSVSPLDHKFSSCHRHKLLGRVFRQTKLWQCLWVGSAVRDRILVKLAVIRDYTKAELYAAKRRERTIKSLLFSELRTSAQREALWMEIHVKCNCM